MNHAEIYRIALAAGFRLKQQPDGTMDLNPYVYWFAEALLEQGRQVATYHRERADGFKAERDEAARKWEEEKAAREALEMHMERLRQSGNRVVHYGCDKCEWDDAVAAIPATSLARREAHWKAEGALDIRHLTQGDDWEDQEIRKVIDDYVASRRQAEEAPSCD